MRILTITVPIMALCVLTPPVASAASPQATFYVSPAGSATAPGTANAPCTLERARDLVRKINGAMTGDIVVNLRGGTYALTAPFKLREEAGTHDSGTGGFNIIYQAAPGETPILNGGVTLTGWTLFDQGKNIYRAKAPDGAYSRQLFVNNRRADRARSGMKPEGWTKTETGWTITDTTMEKWGNQSDMEIVSRSSWKHLRCGIAAISGTTVTMKNPGWLNTAESPHPGHPFNGAGLQCIHKVDWLENAFELLATPGQWYMDRPSGYVYYIPLPTQDMSKANVVLPVLETLVDASGADFEHRLHNVQFKGITFVYATWLGPSGDQGYADNQTGVIWIGTPPTTYKPPGNLSFQYTHDVVFERNVIAHMGGSGLDFGHAPQHNRIRGNCIYDISCNGIFLGEFVDGDETDPAKQSEGNSIQDNYITKVGREYEDGVGICAGYNRHLRLDHNDVSDCPYTAISIGWGWDAKRGYSFENTYSYNHVRDFMLTLGDGGAIYTLGNHGDATHLTVWKGNFLENGPHGNGLYADEGSGFVEITGNLVLKAGGHWLLPHSDHDLRAHDNYTDKFDEAKPDPKRKISPENLKKLKRRAEIMVKDHVVVENNVFDLNPEALPPEAKAIAAGAGLEPEFADIKNQIVKPDIEVAPPAQPTGKKRH